MAHFLLEHNTCRGAMGRRLFSTKIIGLKLQANSHHPLGGLIGGALLRHYLQGTSVKKLMTGGQVPFVKGGPPGPGRPKKVTTATSYASLEAAIEELQTKFPQQYAFILDEHRTVDAQCSRRAGKTSGLAMRFFRTLAKNPKTQSVYLALTLDSARDIMWPVLMELNEKHQMGCVFHESRLEMVHPNGATLKLYGADMKNFIKRLKGRKYPGVAVDEAQDFGDHLQSLIEDVLEPATADYEDGWIAITGTPGPVPQGYFFEITQQRQHGFSHHEWTMLENPFMPNPKGFIDALVAKRKWEEKNPTLLREYRNIWVLDVHSLWIQYVESKCHYDILPDTRGWVYMLGIDIGFKDADALAVIAWHPKSREVYLIEEVITAKQGLTELVEQIQKLQAVYPIVKMVIDEGGLGKKLAEEMRRRHHIPVQPADKARKQENVEFLNDALRLGEFKAKSTSRFAKDSYLVQIDWDKSTPQKIVVKKKPHSDIIDAVLYAFKESPAFTYRKPEAEAAEGSAEWNRKQQDKMFEAEMEGMKAELERQAAMQGYDWESGR